MPAKRKSRRHSKQTPQQIARTRRIHMLLLSLLVFLVFASALGGDFVWTDREDLLQGQHRLQTLSDVPLALTHSRDAYRARHAAPGNNDPSIGSWQPLALLSNSISWGLWGDCAWCFHLENILLHLLVVLGLYALGRHLLSQRRRGNAVAAWAAAVFAIHPATVTSVASIGGRPYLLAAALGVWSLVLFTRLQATTKSRHNHLKRWLIGMAVFALGAMLSHESAYLLPILALLIAGIESKERGRQTLPGISPQRRLAMGLLLAAVSLVLVYRQLALGGLHFGGTYPTDSLLSNTGTALRHFWFVVNETLLPYEPVVSDAWPISRTWTAGNVAALLGLLLLLAVTLFGLKKGHPSAFGSAWFMLCLIPGSGLFPSDHYHSSQMAYLATWGAVFAASYLLYRLWRPLGRQLVPGSEVVVFAPVILTLSIISGLSNARWWDHERLFESEIASDPHYMEGRVELAKSALERGAAEAAMNHALAAIGAANDDGYTGYWPARDAFRSLGEAQWRLGLFAQAANSFDTALESYPNDAELHYWRSLAFLSDARLEDAEAGFQETLKLDPDMIQAEADLGVTLTELERFVEAYPLLKKAIDAGLGNPRRRVALAKVMIDAKQFDQAAEQLEQVLAEREIADERARLAWVTLQMGAPAKAREHLNIALQMEEESSDYVRWVQEQLDASSGAAKQRPQGAQ